MPTGTTHIDTTVLRLKLSRYGIRRTGDLAKALGVTKQRASDILTGKTPIGPKISMRIGAAIGVRWTTVYEWGRLDGWQTQGKREEG